MTDASGHDLHTRVLCLADDRCADRLMTPRIGRALRERAPLLDVVETSNWGVWMIEDVTGAFRLVVLDTVRTGDAPVGTIRVIDGDEVLSVVGNSAHYMSLFEAIELGRYLGLPVPQEVVIVLVEVEDASARSKGAQAALSEAIAHAVIEVEHVLT